MKEFFVKYKVFIIIVLILSFFVLVFFIVYNIINNKEFVFIEEGNEEYFTNNIETIESGNLYFKRNNDIYFRYKCPPDGTFCFNKVGNANLETFKIINPELKFPFLPYAKDENHVYCGGGKVKKADPKTFDFLFGKYFKDKNNIYYQCKNLNVDLETFRVIDEKREYVADKNYVWRGNCKEKFETYLDPSTFEILSAYYAKDKNGAYFIDTPVQSCITKKIENVDLETFEVIGNDDYNTYTKDKNNCYYYRGEIVPMSECEKLTK